MFRIFTRTVMTGAAATALIGASLLLAPAAEAAPRSTHLAAGIDVGAKHESFSFKVGDHRDRLTLDAIGTASKPIRIDGKISKLPARYRISLTRGKHVLLDDRASTYPALLASLNTAFGRNTSDAKVRATAVQTLALPAREAKAGIEATSEQLANESTAVTTAIDILVDVESWRSDHPEATTLDGYTLPAKWTHVGEGLGADLTLTGTPQHHAVRVVIAANGAAYKLDSDGHQRYSKGFLTGQAQRNELR